MNKVKRCSLNYIAIVFFMAGLFSCNSSEMEKKYYSNGQVEQEVPLTNGVPHGKLVDYYPNSKISGIGYFKNGKREGETLSFYQNGNIKTKATYVNGLIHGTSEAYYENGTLKKKIPFQNGNVNGWVEFYNENGQLEAKHEYFTQNTKKYFNQKIVYDMLGRLIRSASNYISLDSELDTIQLGEQYKLLIKLEAPMIAEDSQMEVHIGNFDYEYKLASLSKPDTVKGNDFLAQVTIEPKQRGSHRIRGRVVEYKIRNLEEGQFASEILENHIYFTKNYFVE